MCDLEAEMFRRRSCEISEEEAVRLVYHEWIKRELKSSILIYECRCNARLKGKGEGSTRLTYTGLRGGLEHLKIETRLINERFASAMGECVISKL